MKTAVKREKEKRHVFNESFSFTGNFPSFSSSFLLQVMVSDYCLWKQIAACEIKLTDICFEGKLD